jgi:hypothetical protein
MAWLPQTSLLVECPNEQHFAVGMHVMLALAIGHGMQLECAPIHTFFNSVCII